MFDTPVPEILLKRILLNFCFKTSAFFRRLSPKTLPVAVFGLFSGKEAKNVDSVLARAQDS